MVEGRGHHAGYLAFLVPDPHADDGVEMRVPAELGYLLQGHGPALELQCVNRGGRELAEVVGIGGAEIALRRHVMADAGGDHLGKERGEHDRARLVMMVVDPLLERVFGELVGVVTDVVQQCRGDQCVLCALPLGEHGALQHVLGHGDALAEIGLGTAPGENVADERDDISGRQGGKVMEAHSAASTCRDSRAASVERSPSLSA